MNTVNPSDKNAVDLSQITVNADERFFYQDTPCAIYVKESRKSSNVLKKTPNQSARFHVAVCTTVGDISQQSAQQRYTATTRTDGLFSVVALNETGEKEAVEVKLQICRTCLTKLNYQGYSNSDKTEQDDIAETFNLADFFATYQQSPEPQTEIVLTQLESPVQELIPVLPEIAEVHTQLENPLDKQPVTHSKLVTAMYFFLGLLGRVKRKFF